MVRPWNGTARQEPGAGLARRTDPDAGADDCGGTPGRAAASPGGDVRCRVVGAPAPAHAGLADASREPSPDAAARLLGLDASNPAVEHLHRAAALVAGAKTTADMRDATDALAGGMRAIGLDRWRGWLEDRAGRVELAATANDPGGTKYIDYVTRSLGMSKGQRQMLHREITKENRDDKDIIAARQIMQNFPNK